MTIHGRTDVNETYRNRDAHRGSVKAIMGLFAAGLAFSAIYSWYDHEHQDGHMMQSIFGAPGTEFYNDVESSVKDGVHWLNDLLP